MDEIVLLQGVYASIVLEKPRNDRLIMFNFYRKGENSGKIKYFDPLLVTS